MRSRAATWLAWSLWGVSVTLTALSLLLLVLNRQYPNAPIPDYWLGNALVVIDVTVGAIVASRRPRNPYGWLWLGFGLGLALQHLARSYATYARVVEPGTLLAPLTISNVLDLGGPLALTLAPFLLLLFLTGRLPSRRWRPVAWTAAASGTVIIILDLFFGSPDKVGGVVTIVAVAAAFVIFSVFVPSALSLVRYRRASGVEQQQLKWFAFAAVLAACFLVGQQLSWLASLLIVYFLGGEPISLNQSLENLLEVAINVCLCTAVGIAILRYRLYDIDIIIKRTLVYGSLTLMFVLVYVGGVIALQYILRTLTGQESQFAIVASTLMVAGLFNPLRRRVQTFIDRRFYRRKYDAAKTLEAFSTKLRDETDIDALNSELLSTVSKTMQPEHVSLWLHPDASPKSRIMK